MGTALLRLWYVFAFNRKSRQHWNGFIENISAVLLCLPDVKMHDLPSSTCCNRRLMRYGTPFWETCLLPFLKNNANVSGTSVMLGYGCATFMSRCLCRHNTWGSCLANHIRFILIASCSGWVDSGCFCAHSSTLGVSLSFWVLVPSLSLLFMLSGNMYLDCPDLYRVAACFCIIRISLFRFRKSVWMNFLRYEKVTWLSLMELWRRSSWWHVKQMKLYHVRWLFFLWWGGVNLLKDEDLTLCTFYSVVLYLLKWTF